MILYLIILKANMFVCQTYLTHTLWILAWEPDKSYKRMFHCSADKVLASYKNISAWYDCPFSSLSAASAVSLLWLVIGLASRGILVYIFWVTPFGNSKIEREIQDCSLQFVSRCHCIPQQNSIPSRLTTAIPFCLCVHESIVAEWVFVGRSS